MTVIHPNNMIKVCFPAGYGEAGFSFILFILSSECSIIKMYLYVLLKHFLRQADILLLSCHVSRYMYFL